MNVAKTLTSVVRSLGGQTAPRRGRARRSTRSQMVARRAPERTAALPAAYATHVRSRFRIVGRRGDTVRVTGCDLVYPLPTTVTADNFTLFSVIPANPAYWTGTRISQFAPAYMNYRPIRLRFSYIPQVAVTQPGTVVMGTLWNGAALTADVQQTLFTSNGGLMTQCYVPADTDISLGSALPQNLFQLNGALRPESNPFLFAAAVRGAEVVPGYFYVTYTYDFKNPVGMAWTYGRTIATTTEVEAPPGMNTSAILMSEVNFGTLRLGPGTVLDVEEDGQFVYNGMVIPAAGSYPIQIFYNQQGTPTHPSYVPGGNIYRVNIVNDLKPEEIVDTPVGHDAIRVSQYQVLLVVVATKTNTKFFAFYATTDLNWLPPPSADGEKWYYRIQNWGTTNLVHEYKVIEVVGSEQNISSFRTQGANISASIQPSFTAPKFEAAAEFDPTLVPITRAQK